MRTRHPRSGPSIRYWKTPG